jgi:hypothetical protein
MFNGHTWKGFMQCTKEQSKTTVSTESLCHHPAKNLIAFGYDCIRFVIKKLSGDWLWGSAARSSTSSLAFTGKLMKKGWKWR